MIQETLSDSANIYDADGCLTMMGVAVDIIVEDEPDREDSLIINGTTYPLSDFEFEPYDLLADCTSKIEHYCGWHVIY